MSLSELTIVIPVFNRPKYLLRQLEYWKDSDAKILIMDGSSEPLPEIVLAQLTPNIQYVYLKSEFIERLVSSCPHLNTKYTVLLHDDELYTRSGLEVCVAELENDIRLIGCQGRSLYFFYQSRQVLAHEVYFKNTDVKDNFSDGVSRMKNSFPNGDPSFAPYALYSVLRTEKWKTLIELSYSRFYGCGYVYELAFQIGAMALGPIKVVDHLLWLRSGENPKQTSAAVNRTIGTGEWGTSQEYEDEFEDFVHRLTEVLSVNGVASRHESEEVVREIAEQFFSYSLHKPYRPIAYWQRLLLLISKFTPKWIKSLLKRNMTKTLGVVLDYKGIEFNGALDQMRRKGVKFDSEESRKIHRFLLNFHSALENN
jgi:glycosyltransferase domain-containing protein